MADDILFQRDRLTVTKSHLTVGRVTAFYSNISAISIYDGRPLMPAAIASMVGLVPLSFLFFTGVRLFGPVFPSKIVLLGILPMGALLVGGFLYRVKCLFITLDGQAVAVLKSNDLAVLEQAKSKIEEAKAAAGTRT